MKKNRDKKTKKNWAKSLLALAKRATKSGIKNLSKNHDKYLLAPKCHPRGVSK